MTSCNDSGNITTGGSSRRECLYLGRKAGGAYACPFLLVTLVSMCIAGINGLEVGQSMVIAAFVCIHNIMVSVACVFLERSIP